MSETEKRQPRVRRFVSDEEYRRAYEGDPTDPKSVAAASDNRNIIKSVLFRYRDKLPPESLQDCGLVGLWRALQYHQPKFNQKFTTSLFRFVAWECKREYRNLHGRKRRRRRIYTVPLTDEAAENLVATPAIDDVESKLSEDFAVVQQHLRRLMPEDRKLIRQYYMHGFTMQEIGEANGYSKESARHRVNHATDSLKDLCRNLSAA